MSRILVYDIETNSIDVEKAKLKWFGAYSYIDNEYYLYDNHKTDKIKKLISRHDVFIGFNSIEYDKPILEKAGYKMFGRQIDLYQIVKQKKRLNILGYKPESYSLRSIAQMLGFTQLKGNIDYNVFKKDKWMDSEIKQIKKYLKADIDVSKEFYEWLEDQFKILKSYLRKDHQEEFKHLTTSPGSLAYYCICDYAGVPVVWDDKAKKNGSITGGHHILPKHEKVRGNIFCLDFASAYPNAMIQANLFSSTNEGYDGGDYFNLNGCYKNDKQGIIEKAIKNILFKRLEAKNNNNKQLDQSLKIIINSIYGISGNPVFTNFYNPTLGSDTTQIVRSWLRKVTARLYASGCKILYGFTDSIFILKPDYLTESEILSIVNNELDKSKESMPFPSDTFKMDIDKRIKFIWFIHKNGKPVANNYFWVDTDDILHFKGGGTFDKNTPEVVKQVYDEFIAPNIIKNLDVNFSEESIKTELLNRLKNDPALAGQYVNVKECHNYKVETSENYQISKKHGAGKHLLICNTAGVGIGKDKGTKKRAPIRKCTLKEFKDNNLKAENISIYKIMKYLNPFCMAKSEVIEK